MEIHVTRTAQIATSGYFDRWVTGKILVDIEFGGINGGNEKFSGDWDTAGVFLTKFIGLSAQSAVKRLRDAVTTEIIDGVEVPAGTINAVDHLLKIFRSGTRSEVRISAATTPVSPEAWDAIRRGFALCNARNTILVSKGLRPGEKTIVKHPVFSAEAVYDQPTIMDALLQIAADPEQTYFEED